MWLSCAYLRTGQVLQTLPRPTTVLEYMTGLPQNPSVSSNGHSWTYFGNFASPMFDPRVQVHLTLHLKAEGSLKNQLQGLICSIKNQPWDFMCSEHDYV